MPAVLVLRPEPANTQTCRAARTMGLDAHAAPLFTYAPRRWVLPPVRFDGLLIGSAAVLGLGGAQLTALHLLPVLAVGATTARAARAAGFTVVATGTGGMQPLADRLPPGRYLRLTGEAHVALTAPEGAEIEDVVVYAAEPQPLSDEASALISQGEALALLHSAEAARHFGQECDSRALPRNTVALACLGPRIAEAAGPGWKKVGIAAHPANEAVLSLAGQMCQTVWPRGHG